MHKLRVGRNTPFCKSSTNSVSALMIFFDSSFFFAELHELHELGSVVKVRNPVRNDNVRQHHFLDFFFGFFIGVTIFFLGFFGLLAESVAPSQLVALPSIRASGAIRLSSKRGSYSVNADSAHFTPPSACSIS